MAAMNQEKLGRMCTAINKAAESYVTQVSSSVTSLTETFNNNWVSNSSKELASEITQCLNSLADEITLVFSNKNDAIKLSVSNFNSVEHESISYAGFSFGKPSTKINLGSALPNGKVGVADGADLSTINTPMNKMVTNVKTVLTNIINTVKSADAFDLEEQSALTKAVTNIKTKFETAITEIERSLQSRMSNEISLRDRLNATNKSNLGA